MVRIRADKEESQKLANNFKDTSLNIWKLVLCLVIFVSGVVIGLISSSHVDLNRYIAMSSSPSTLPDPSIFYTANPINNNIFDNKPSNGGDCVSGKQVKKQTNLDCTGFDNFVHPKELLHKLTDDELFWKASMVPKIGDFPFKRVPKVAFMFLTRGPLPFLPLWERFFGGYEEYFSIYVHTQPDFILNVSPDSVFFGRQILSQKVSWGDVSLVDAEKRLMANALLDFSNERFVLISESCIPIYNFTTVYRYLVESVHSFVEAYDEPTRYGRGRYHRYMSPEIRLYQWRKGSQWFEMSRVLAIEIISDYKYFDIFRKYCHPSCYPDEHYLPTYLNMFHPSLNSNRTVTWVDWSLGGPHPATFGRENVTESFIQNIRRNGTECWYNSQRTDICFLFARKFDTSALEPLLELSSRLMGF